MASRVTKKSSGISPPSIQPKPLPVTKPNNLQKEKSKVSVPEFHEKQKVFADNKKSKTPDITSNIPKEVAFGDTKYEVSTEVVQKQQNYTFYNPSASNTTVKVTLKPITPILLLSDKSRKVNRDNEYNNFVKSFKSVSKTFVPYENLTGFSKERPEILALSEFKSIYDDFFYGHTKEFSGDKFINGLNEYGEFIDFQIQTQNLLHYKIIKFIEDTKNTDQEQKKILQQKENEFNNKFNILNKNVNVLYSLVKYLNENKKTFDLKQLEVNESWLEVIRKNFNSYSKNFLQYLDKNVNYSKESMNTMLSKFGFTKGNIQLFSSTKIYLQFLNEYRNLFDSLSDNFLSYKQQRKTSDNKPDTIYISEQHIYSDLLRSFDKIESPVFKDIANLNYKSVLPSLPVISKMLENTKMLFSTKEDEIAFYMIYLSREFLYSKVIKDQAFINAVSAFNYTIKTKETNYGMFDFVLGRIGKNIGDIFETNNALSTLAVQVKDNIAVLPFESFYIESDKSTYTPGTEYYIDSSLEEINSITNGVDVSRLKDLQTTVNNLKNRYRNFIDKLGILNLLPDNSEDLSGQTRAISIKKPNAFLNRINLLDNEQTPSYAIANDAMTGIINFAFHDKKLYDLFFLYFCLRYKKNSGSVYNYYGQVNPNLTKSLNLPNKSELIIEEEKQAITVVIDEIISILIKKNAEFNSIKNKSELVIENFKKTYDLNSDINNNVNYPHKKFSITTSDIKENLANNETAVIKYIIDVMEYVYLSFKDNNVMTEDNTNFSYISDSIIMSMAYRLAMLMINNHINTKISDMTFTLDLHESVNEYSYIFNVDSVQTNVGSKYSLIKTKINNEYDLMLQSTLVLLNTLTQISDTCNNLIVRLQSQDVTNSISYMLNLLGDKKYLPYLLKEQQIILSKSIIDNLKNKIDENKELSYSNGDKNGFIILNDLVFGDKLKNCFYSFFAQDKYNSNKSYNGKIISVGIPHGFNESIKEKIKVSSLNVNSKTKQDDLVYINVYKIDCENTDIIFKPQKFLFELSRFTQTQEKNIKKVSIDGNINNIIHGILTKDYSVELQNATGVEEVLEKTSLFNDQQYDFLTTQQKYEVVINHITSYMLNLYQKLLTGVSIDESIYEIKYDNYFSYEQQNIERSILENLLKSAIEKKTSNQQLITSMTNFFSSPNSTTSPPPQIRPPSDFDSSIKEYQSSLDSLETVNQLSSTHNNLAIFENFAKGVVVPKEFERIFHIFIDPDDFEIDVEMTNKFEAGSKALKKLTEQGKIVTISNSILSSNVGNLKSGEVVKFAEKNKKENNLIFEKYFVNLEFVSTVK